MVLREQNEKPVLEHRPSYSQTWMNCAASIRLGRGIVESPSDYADEGSAQHVLNAWCLSEERAPEEKLGQAFEEYPTWPVTEENVQCAHAFLDYVRAQDFDVIYVESAIDFSHLIPGGTGHSDVIGVKGDVLHVIDYKHGKGVRVFAKGNTQLAIYAAGAFNEFSCLTEFRSVVLHIVQPRLDVYESHEMTPDALHAFEERVVDAYRATLDDNAVATPGNKQCKFCKARAVCPALAEHNLRQALEPFETLSDLDEGEPECRPVEAMSNEDLGRVMKHLKLIKSWASAVEDHALAVAARGEEVPGWKLVRTSANRRWKNEEEAIARLRKAGLRLRDVTQQKILGIPAIEKKLGKKHPVLPDLIEKPEGKLTLAPSDDKRAEVEAPSVSAFEKLA